MSRKVLILIVAVTITLTAYITLALNTNWYNALPKSTTNPIVSKAKQLYTEEKLRGRDFSTGPCLSDALQPDWVVDIAHNPRIPSDDLPQNECPSYLQGRSHHFVELDTEGNLIRVK